MIRLSLKELLDKIIGLHFDDHEFTLKGSLDWFPIFEKQKERYFKKFGKELKNQRRRYKIKEVYWEGNNEGVKGGYGSSHHHIVISDIEEDGVFYLMNDHRVGRMGQTFRYKFQIRDFNGNTKLSDCKFELLDKRMTMIR
tara:strand:- start:611 stop:1030 length:420 start_codon:yes stop_codon:yes gene_type:complete